MEVKIPKHINLLRVKHSKAFELLLKGEDLTVLEKINIISIITGYDINKLKQYKWDDLRKVYNKILECLGTYKQKEIPLSVTYNGVKYNLVDKFSKLPTSWFIDADSIDLKENPSLLVAFCYIEDGMSYCEIDKHNNILNPLRDRAKIFEDNFPLDAFLDLSAFFLQKHKQYKKSLIMIKEARESLEVKREKRLNGRR